MSGSEKQTLVEVSAIKPTANTETPSQRPAQGQPWTAGLIGQHLENLKLLTLLKPDELGAVFLAEDSCSKSRFAVKVLHPTLNQHPDRVHSYFKVAQQLNALGSPHIVSLTNCLFQPSGPTYLVMKALTGFSIAQANHRFLPISLSSKLEIALQVAKTLATAHKQGIAHQCLTPKSIFLVRGPEQRYQAKILNFGEFELLPTSNRREHLKYQRDIQSFGRIFADWVENTPQESSSISAPLRAIFQQCIQSCPTESYLYMDWVYNKLHEIEALTICHETESHETENEPKFTPSSDSSELAPEGQWENLEWKKPRHFWRKPKIVAAMMSLAALGIIATLGLPELPLNLKSDSPPTPRKTTTTRITPRRVPSPNPGVSTTDAARPIGTNVFENQNTTKPTEHKPPETNAQKDVLIALTFTSTPPGAEVRESGSKNILGITPFAKALSQKRKHFSFAFQKAGFLGITTKFTPQKKGQSAATIHTALKPHPIPPKNNASKKAQSHSKSSGAAQVATPPNVNAVPTPKKRGSNLKKKKPSRSSHRKKKSSIKAKTTRKSSPQPPKPKTRKSPEDQHTLIDPFAQE